MNETGNEQNKELHFEKGTEPEEFIKHINLLMKELHEAFPHGLINVIDWKHERWDALVEFLYPKLGYTDNVAFLKDYGFDIFGELITNPQMPVENTPIERTQRKALVCPHCGSDDISIDTFQENLGTSTVSNQSFKVKQKGHGLLWWLFIGWWWWIIDLCLWIFVFPLRLLAQIFKKKKYKGTATTVSQSINEVVYKKVLTCRSCGHSWTAEAGQGSTVSAISKSKENIKQLKRNVR